jgi:NAD(P)-dependent dehydrogenase (short-subunit alcohol dehydrogenase family)
MELSKEFIAQRLHLRRLGQPDGIARAALFLYSDAASWLTGETLIIDGGALSMPGGGVS